MFFVRILTHMICALIFMACIIATLGLLIAHPPTNLWAWPLISVWFLLQAVGFWSSANSTMRCLRCL